jgi:hypothetical protein
MSCCSELFWSNLVITCSTILLAVIAILYKSKCSHVKCCGLDIERNVEIEEDIDEMELQEHKNNRE